MTTSRRIAFSLFAAPLALALSACGDDSASGELEGEAIAAIPAPDGQEWASVTQVTESDGYLIGNPDAPLKLIEYGSLTCGACANFAQTGTEQLVSEYVNSGVVSFELRNQVHNAFDVTLARLVRCSAPESFHPLAQQVWTNFDTIMGGAQAASSSLQAAGDIPPDELYVAIGEAAGFLDFFAARGISRDQGATCLADAESVLAIQERSDRQSDELNITSTPTFILNGRQLEEKRWEDLEPVLQRAGARTE